MKNFVGEVHRGRKIKDENFSLVTAPTAFFVVFSLWVSDTQVSWSEGPKEKTCLTKKKNAWGLGTAPLPSVRRRQTFDLTIDVPWLLFHQKSHICFVQ